MEELFIYLITFITIYLVYYFFVILKIKKGKKIDISNEVHFLEKKYNLNIKKIGLVRLYKTVALSNAFIIANTALIVTIIDNYILKMLVGFVILVPMIIAVYTLIGKHYQKLGGK